MKKAIDAELLQEIVDYIINKPYREVAGLIDKIKAETFEEVKIVEKEDIPTEVQDAQN